MLRLETMKQVTCLGDPGHAFLGVELNPIGTKTLEGPLSVLDQMVGPPGLDHDVVDVDLNDLSDFVMAPLHAVQVRHPDIFEANEHRHVALRAEWSDGVNRELVGLLHPDLVIHRVCVKEAHGFAPCGRGDHT